MFLDFGPFKTHCFLGAILALFICSESSAGSSAHFLKINPSVRLSALGGYQAAAAGNADMAFSNPASLGSLDVPQFWAGHDESLLNSNYEILGLGIPFRQRHALLLSTQYLNDGKIDRTGIDTASNRPIDGLGSIHPYVALLNVGYGTRITNKLFLGVSAKGWSEQLDQTSTQSAAWDAGVQLRSIFNRISLGIARKNQGPGSHGDPLPASWDFGGEIYMARKKSTAALLLMDYEHNDHGHRPIRAGLELQHSFLYLRGGLPDLEFSDNQVGNFNAGIGIKFRGWNIDYAWVDAGNFGSQHLIQLTINLGLTKDEKIAAMQKLDQAILERMRERSTEQIALARAAAEKMDWNLAIAHLRDASTWDPSNKNLNQEITQLQIKINAESKPSQPRQEIKLEIKSSPPPSNPSAKIIDNLCRNAYTYYMSGNIDEAITTWKKVLTLDPENQDARWALKEAVPRRLPQGQKRLGETERKVQELNIQAFQEYSEGRLQNALDIWRSALSLDPRNMKLKGNIERAENELALNGVSR